MKFLGIKVIDLKIVDQMRMLAIKSVLAGLALWIGVDFVYKTTGFGVPGGWCFGFFGFLGATLFIGANRLLSRVNHLLLATGSEATATILSAVGTGAYNENINSQVMHFTLDVVPQGLEPSFVGEAEQHVLYLDRCRVGDTVRVKYIQGMEVVVILGLM